MSCDRINQLERRRRILVNDFLASNTEGQERAEGENLASSLNEHNNIVSWINQERRVEGPRKDPLIILPPEIWIDCFLYLIVEDPDWVYLSLMVCRRWRRDILTVPTLWRHISVLPTDPDLPQKMATAIFLSQNLPLSIVFRITHVGSEDMVEMRPLLAVSHRIREVSLEVEDMTMKVTREWKILRKIPFLPQFETLPNLASLRIGYRRKIGSRRVTFSPDQAIPTPVPLLYPSLQVLRGYIVDAEAFRSTYLQTLAEIEIECDVGEIMTSINYLPALKSLTIHSRDSDEPIVLQGDQDRHLRKCRLTRLSSLDYDLVGDHPVFSIQTLQEIQLSLRFHEVPKFLEKAFHLPFLSRLTLRMSGLFPMDIYIPQFLGILNDLSFFSLQFTTWAGRVQEPGRGLRPLARLLFESFISTAPNIRRLEIDSNVPFPSNLAFRSTQKLRHLEALKFAGSADQVPMRRWSFRFPSLIYLEMSSSNHLLNLLASIHAPQLQELRLDGLLEDLSNWNHLLEVKSLTSLKIGSNHVELLDHIDAPTLASLQWGHFLSDSVACSNPSAIFKVSSLVELFLPHTGGKEPHELVLLTLIRDPTVLPNLKRLGFYSYPSFALLFRALLRRNVFRRDTDSNLSLINTIDLPGLPAYTVLYPLTRLLGGYWIMSSELLAADSLDQVILQMDNNSPSCSYCPEAGLRCAYIPVKQRYAGPTSRDAERGDDEDLHYYSEDVWGDVDKWIEEWASLSVVRAARSKKAERRRRKLHTCSFHFQPDLISITKDTLGRP